MVHFGVLPILALPLLGACDYNTTAAQNSTTRTPNRTLRASRSDPCDGGRYDVVIVGAGLSGLSAAKELRATGHKVIILEARNRVGGRVHGERLKNGDVQEMGAEFIGPTQDKMYALAKELGLQIYNEYDTGNTTFFVNGSVTTLGPGGLDQVSVKQYFDANNALDELAAEIDVQAPWSHPKAKEWDQIPYADWMNSQVSTGLAQSLQAVQTTSIFSAEPHEVSLLYVAAYTAAAGNETSKGTMSRLTATTDGAQQDRIVGGSQLFATKLAEKLRFQGVRIKLNSPVESIRRYKSGYVAETESEGDFCGKKIVVAMSPPLAKRISYSPPLPRDRTKLMAGMRMASVGKVIAIYDQPFWRNSSLNGQALADVGAARSTFDNSPADGRYGALMAFVEGDEMRHWDRLSERALRARVLQEYATYFGPEAVSGVRDFISMRWNLEEWSRGGPVAFTLPGVLSKFGASLRKPVDGIHFAGTETSDHWVGYMEGAVRSGERVAQEIVRSVM